MKKSLHHVLRITGGVSILFLLFCLAFFILVSVNKEKINEMATRQINRQIRGIVHIGDISPDFLKAFPNISVRLSDVSIRDSLWDHHHHDFLKAEKIFINFQFLSLFTGKPKIKNVIVQGGSIYLYTDECGYCNLNRSNDVSFSRGQTDIPKFRIEHTRMIMENENQNSYHDIYINYLGCNVVKKDSAFALNIAMNSLVHSVGFNMDKGSYLKEKPVDGKYCLLFYPGKKIKLIDVGLNIDQAPFTINGNINLDTASKSYDITIQTKKILYSKAIGLLTESLREKMKFLDILRPLDAEATITGQMAPDVEPGITTHFTVNDAEIKTSLSDFTHCTFSGSFTNHVDSLLTPGDENSKFIFTDIRGNRSNITLSSVRTEISNLIQPYIISDIHSVFDLADLNALTESTSIRFLKGIGNLNVRYNGSMMNNDSLNAQLNGNLILSDAEINYLPRNLIFDHCNGTLEFKDEDLIISQISATAGNTQLIMNGQVTNLLALININPEKLILEWNISTHDLNLNDFVSYIGQRAEVPTTKYTGKNKMIKMTENIDRMLSDGTVKINVSADKMTYKKFVATGVGASLLLVGNKVMLNDVRLNHAGGKLFLKGSLTNGNHSNFLNLETRIENVDIPGIFHAFDNFGQDAITSQNLKGNLSAQIQIEGVITDKAQILENSMKGSVDFVVKNGELNDFEPAIKIAATAFKKRDFSKLQFAELNNELEINGSAIQIHKMEIRSNVVILFVEGIYDSKNGTDMSIQVPVSNLSKAEKEIDNTTGQTGVNIRLRAKTGDDGKLKITWDPFNNASKQRKEENKTNLN